MSFVRYGLRFLTKKRSTVGYLARYGSRIKTETENGVFLQRYGKRFSLKNGKRYGFRLRCRGFLSPNRGNGRSRNGRVRYGTVRVTNSDALLYHLWRHYTILYELDIIPYQTLYEFYDHSMAFQNVLTVKERS